MSFFDAPMPRAFVWTDFELGPRLRGGASEPASPACRRYRATVPLSIINQSALLQTYPAHASSPDMVVSALRGDDQHVDVVLTRLVLDREVGHGQSIQAVRVRMLLKLMRDGYLNLLGAFWDSAKPDIDDEAVIRGGFVQPSLQALRSSLSAFAINQAMPAPLPVLVLAEPFCTEEFGLQSLESMLNMSRIRDSMIDHDVSTSAAACSPLPASRQHALNVVADSYQLNHVDPSFATTGVMLKHALNNQRANLTRQLHASAVVSVARRLTRRALKMLHQCHVQFKQPYASLAPSQVFVHQNGEVYFGWPNVYDASPISHNIGFAWFQPPEILARPDLNPYSCSRDVWSLGILLASWCLGSVPIHGAEASTILLTIFKLIGRPPREDVLYLGDMHDRLIAALPSALLSLPLAGQSPPTSPERAVSPSSLLSANQTNSTTPTLLSWLAALSQPAALIELVAACLQYAPIKRPLPSDLLHLYSFAALDSVHHAACHSDVDSMALKDVVSSTELVDLPDLAWRADAATQLQTSLNIPSETVLRSAQKAKPATVPAVRSNAIPRFVDSSDLPTESAVRVTSARVMPSVAAAVSLFSAPLVTMSESLSMDKLRSASDQLNKLNVSMDHQVQPTDSAAISQRFAVDLVPPAAVNSESGDPEMKPVVLPSSLLRSFTELSDYASPTLATANLDLRTMYPHLFDKDSLISEVMKKEAASLKEHVSVLKTDLQTMISQVETMRLGSDVAPANICDQGAFRQHSVEEQMQALRESTRLISNVGQSPSSKSSTSKRSSTKAPQIKALATPKLPVWKVDKPSSVKKIDSKPNIESATQLLSPAKVRQGHRSVYDGGCGSETGCAGWGACKQHSHAAQSPMDQMELAPLPATVQSPGDAARKFLPARVTVTRPATTDSKSLLNRALKLSQQSAQKARNIQALKAGLLGQSDSKTSLHSSLTKSSSTQSVALKLDKIFAPVDQFAPRPTLRQALQRVKAIKTRPSTAPSASQLAGKSANVDSKVELLMERASTASGRASLSLRSATLEPRNSASLQTDRIGKSTSQSNNSSRSNSAQRRQNSEVAFGRSESRERLDRLQALKTLELEARARELASRQHKAAESEVFSTSESTTTIETSPLPELIQLVPMVPAVESSPAVVSSSESQLAWIESTSPVVQHVVPTEAAAVSNDNPSKASQPATKVEPVRQKLSINQPSTILRIRSQNAPVSRASAPSKLLPKKSVSISTAPSKSSDKEVIIPTSQVRQVALVDSKTEVVSIVVEPESVEEAEQMPPAASVPSAQTSARSRVAMSKPIPVLAIEPKPVRTVIARPRSAPSAATNKSASVKLEKPVIAVPAAPVSVTSATRTNSTQKVLSSSASQSKSTTISRFRPSTTVRVFKSQSSKSSVPIVIKSTVSIPAQPAPSQNSIADASNSVSIESSSLSVSDVPVQSDSAPATASSVSDATSASPVVQKEESVAIEVTPAAATVPSIAVSTQSLQTAASAESQTTERGVSVSDLERLLLDLRVKLSADYSASHLSANVSHSTKVQSESLGSTTGSHPVAVPIATRSVAVEAIPVESISTQTAAPAVVSSTQTDAIVTNLPESCMVDSLSAAEAVGKSIKSPTTKAQSSEPAPPAVESESLAPSVPVPEWARHLPTVPLCVDSQPPIALRPCQSTSAFKSPFTILASPQVGPKAVAAQAVLPELEDLGCHRFDFVIESVFKLNLECYRSVPLDSLFLTLALPVAGAHNTVSAFEFVRLTGGLSAFVNNHASLTQHAPSCNGDTPQSTPCSCVLSSLSRALTIGARLSVLLEPAVLNGFLRSSTPPALLLCCDLKSTDESASAAPTFSEQPMWGTQSVPLNSPTASTTAPIASLSIVLGYALIDLAPIAFGLGTIDGWYHLQSYSTNDVKRRPVLGQVKLAVVPTFSEAHPHPRTTAPSFGIRPPSVESTPVASQALVTTLSMSSMDQSTSSTDDSVASLPEEISKPVNAVRGLLDRTMALHLNSLSAGSELNDSTWIEFNRYLTEYTTQFPAEAAASVPFSPLPKPDASSLMNAAELSHVNVAKSVTAAEVQSFLSSMNQTPVAAQQSVVSELKSVSKQSVARKALSTSASATPSLKSTPARRPVASSSASVTPLRQSTDRSVHKSSTLKSPTRQK